MVGKPTRRSFLKKAGATGIGIGLVPTATGEQPLSLERFKHHTQKAMEIRRRAGMEAGNQYLKAQGIPVSSTVSGMSVHGDSGGVSTQEYDCSDGRNGDEWCDSDIKFSISIEQNWNAPSYHIDFMVNYSYSVREVDGDTIVTEFPEHPEDGFSLKWDENEWTAIYPDDPSASTSSTDHIYWEENSFNSGEDSDGSVGFVSKGNEHYLDERSTYSGGKKWTGWIGGGVYLDMLTSDEYDADVTAEFGYSSNSFGEITGMTIGYPWTFGISYDEATHTEYTRHEEGSDIPLRVRGDEV